jgi:hypothetical protein
LHFHAEILLILTLACWHSAGYISKQFFHEQGQTGNIKDGIVISDYMQVTELGNYEKPI